MNADLEELLFGSVQRKLLLTIGLTAVLAIGALVFLSTGVATEQVTAASHERTRSNPP